MKHLIRGVIILIGLIFLWQLVVWLTQLPGYILPSPLAVFYSLINNASLLAHESVPTLIEIVLGFVLGSLLGIFCALFITYVKPVRMWFLPILLISQALPTFAIAPLLVVWLGYGIAAKVVITMIMLFFPVTSSFYDGLRATPQIWLDLAKTMNASSWQLLWRIKVPAALPRLASGLRVAATIAPLGALIGEWVGSSKGLGYLMINADARMQIDLMFAVLIIVTVLTLALYFAVDKALKKLISWESVQ